MYEFPRFKGLIAAPHPPFHPDGSFHLQRIEDQQRHFRETGVAGVFVAGTTGEGQSLTVTERIDLAAAWVQIGKPAGIRVIIHVGDNCLRTAQELARHAQRIGTDGIACLAPYFFKPQNVDELVSYCGEIAQCAPELPFFYYDIPALTGVELPMSQFLVKASQRIKNLAGIKFTNTDLVEFQRCMRFDKGRFDILFGWDEALLAGLTLGAEGAIGSTYNFAAPLYQRMIRAFAEGDLQAAQADQAKSVAMVAALSKHGYSAAAKAVMAMIGVDCGPVRPSLVPLTDNQLTQLRQDLDLIGFFDWSQVDASKPPRPKWMEFDQSATASLRPDSA